MAEVNLWDWGVAQLWQWGRPLQESYDWSHWSGWSQAGLDLWQTFPWEISAFFGGILAFVTLRWWITQQRKKQQHMRKLWDLLVFFLMKRQMSIPIIYTLSKRQQLFSAEKLAELLTMREQCQQLSLRTQTNQRLDHERNFSQLLFRFFSQAEASQSMKLGSALRQLAEDFEFMDQKLVQIQGAYNAEVAIWNRSWAPWWKRPLRWSAGFELQPELVI